MKVLESEQRTMGLSLELPPETLKAAHMEDNLQLESRELLLD